MNHLRSLVIALVVLGLSAGAVFATKSLSDIANASSAGLANASAASGRVVPSTPDATSGTARADADETTGTDATSGSDASTGTDASTGSKPTDNHGAFVSAAAHLTFDQLKTACAGFDGKNKGAYVSAIARGLLVVTLPPDVTSGTTVDSSAGTTVATITCTVPSPVAAPTTSTDATTGTTTAPTRLHGQANAAARRALHPRPRHD